jgi:2-polyprenyl-3-methyl-5-hydroxy-6-metoxy-1,4-benzoquinol methylase
VHFFSRSVPKLLRRHLPGLEDRGRVVDVGCGDGQLVWSLLHSGVLPSSADVVGVDISPIRVQRFKALTGRNAVLADGQDLAVLKAASVDFCISTMVMEHVPSDRAYAGELARIVRAGGTLYLTTVLRKRGAWYFRKAPDGRRVLDPTHLREYASPDLVIEVLKDAGFKVVDFELERLLFPVVHPMVRWWNAVSPIPDVQRLFLSEPWSSLERFALPIPRYRAIELILERQ